MELFGFDLSNLFSLQSLLAIILGTFSGLLIGTVPGLGATIAIVLLLPITYTMEPLAAILLLVAAYQGAEYGGSISSIIIGVPGTPAAVATVLDGNALAKKSYPGKALGYSLTASTIGGIIGGIVLLLLAIPLAAFAINFSDPEYFLIGILGLMAVAGLSSKDITKSGISVILGLMLGTIGLDILSGVPRFTLGRVELIEGVTMIALLVGMFAFSEMFSMVSNDLNKKYVKDSSNLSTKITLKEFKNIFKPTIKGSFIGSIVGIFPGMGAGPASWFSYSEAKRTSKISVKFGEGNPEGIAAPESANNATVGGALIPLLSLGIPGSPATAIILGAFIIHGIQPGPNIFTSNSSLVYGIFFGFLIATISMYILGRNITALFARALTVPTHILIPIIIVLSLLGVFVARGLFFDLWFALLVGVICFFIKKLDFSLPSLILAFVLAPMIEESFRRSLLLSNGSYSVFFERVYSIGIMVVIAALIFGLALKKYKEYKLGNRSSENKKNII